MMIKPAWTSRAVRAAVERTGLCFLAGMERGLRSLGRFLWWNEVIYGISALDSRFIVLDQSVTGECLAHRGARRACKLAGIVYV